jgi:hypothetical protein|eukprot:COSAG01_NODE_4961_length_4588_cov_10.530185_1_plen_274_part_00
MARASGWFAQLHYLMQKREWGFAVGFKPGKTDPVATEALWIGYLFKCRTMIVALHEERLVKMKLKLQPFRAQNGGDRAPTIAHAKNLIGVLQFGANIIVIGKAYLAEIRKIVLATDAQFKFGKAPADTPFKLSKRSRHQADMWNALIETMALRSAYIGIRRQTFPHTAQSDASFSKVVGWCWAQMGQIHFGSWPAAWIDKIGAHSEFADIFITEQPAAGSASSRNISRRRRRPFRPPSAVVVFETFSFPPTIPIFSYSTYEYGKVSHADCIVY